MFIIVTKEDAKRLLESLVNSLTTELSRKPFFLVTEHDISGYLYSKLFQMKELQATFSDLGEEGNRNFKIHLEYPRYRRKEGMLRNKGRYDVVILNEHVPIEKEFENDECDKKPVWLGFEIKLYWDEKAGKVKNGLENELRAFWKRDEECERFPADCGVILHVNVAKTCGSSDEEFSSIREEMKRCQKDKNIASSLSLIYIESYRKENKPKVVMELGQ